MRLLYPNFFHSHNENNPAARAIIGRRDGARRTGRVRTFRGLSQHCFFFFLLYAFPLGSREYRSPAQTAPSLSIVVIGERGLRGRVGGRAVLAQR